MSKKKTPSLEHDWDSDKSVVVHNKSGSNILLNLPTGSFRLDAGRAFRMTPGIADVPQVKELLAAGRIEISDQ